MFEIFLAKLVRHQSEFELKWKLSLRKYNKLVLMMANVNEQANRNSSTYALKYWIIIRKISVVCYFDSQFVCDWWVCTCQNGIFEPLSRYGYARPCMFVHMVLIHLSSVQIVNAIALMALSLNADFSHSQKQPKRNQFKLIKFPTVVQRAINYITHSVASLFSLCLQNENRRILCFLCRNKRAQHCSSMSLKVVAAVFMNCRKIPKSIQMEQQQKKLIREHSKAIWVKHTRDTIKQHNGQMFCNMF